MKRGLLYLCSVVALLCSEFVLASQENIRFQKYNLEHGLTQQAVFDILQDRQGFMWFATQEGLNRFDGYQFRTFYHDADDANSLSYDAVYTMVEDKQGMLWFGTDGGGLDRFDPKSQLFSHYLQETHQLSSNRINIVFEDNEQVLWVGTYDGGLNHFNKSAQSFQSYRHDKTDEASLNSDHVRAIHQDPLGRLWIGTDKGINLYDKQNHRFSNFKKNQQAPAALSEDGITTIFTDLQGRLWIGTHHSGLIRMDHDKSFHLFQHDEQDKHSLCHNWVSDIFQDRAGLIWIATDNGLCQWQAESSNFIRFRHDARNLYSLSDNRTLSLHQDRGGVLWLGTFGGLNKWTATGFAHYRQETDNNYSLTSNIITAFAESPGGDIWVGSYDGLNRFDRQTKQFTQIKSASDEKDGENSKKGLSDNRIMSLFGATDNTLWIGTFDSGLDHYNPATGQFTNYQHDIKNPQSISGNGITYIIEDKQRNLWIAVYGGGLNRFNRQQDTFEHFRHDPAKPDSLSTDNILTLYQTQDDVLWIGSEGGGLNRLDNLSGKFTHFRHQSDNPDSLSSDVAWSILEGPGGDLWIGTWGGGLNRWTQQDRQAGQVRFKHYGKKEGLNSHVIYNIIADPQGFLWLSTNRGLIKFDPSTEQAKHYDITHGLQDNEFNHNAAFSSANGQIFFGGSKGFNAFFAEQIGINAHQPPVILTSIIKLNRESGVGENVLALSDIQFGYQDYVVTFEFAGLDYAAPQKNQYKYKLEGFDQDWIEMGTTRRTTFTNLPAGNYVFRVKAANNDGIWSEQGLARSISVTPPPWKTWWAYSLYLLIMITILFIYLSAHAKKLREKAQYSRHLENQVSLRTAELTTANEALAQAKEAAEIGNRSKGAFISIMSHEVRTPMTSIIGFAESIIEDKVKKDEMNRRISKIISNGKHLLQLMNNVLDNSKIEAKRLDIENIPLSPVTILQELEDLISYQARNKGLTLAINYQFPIPTMIHGDPTRLKQILLNLCSNAIKFTHQGGLQINVHTEKQLNQLHFSVVDTGIGIPPDKRETVFEAFSQADSSTTRKYGGTGLGLSIAKQLSEAMGGGMALVSSIDKGCEFTFNINMGHPPPDQWIEDQQGIHQLLSLQPLAGMKVPTLNGRILLAEDWPDNQELICMYIKRTGASVTLVENGKLAVETALAEDFDLILMDVQMPEVDGIEATQILRAAGFSKPIIALTADVSKTDVEHYLASGFDYHLGKPIEREIFYQTLASYLPEAGHAEQLPVIDDSAEHLALVNSFLQRLPETMFEIQLAAQQQGWQKLGLLLHNLKGSGGSFGFPALSKVAEPIAEALAAGRNQDALAKLDQLQQVISMITQENGSTSLGELSSS